MLSRSYLPKDKPKALLAYSPMLHARLFQETARFRDEHFQPKRSSLTSKDVSDEPRFLDGNPEIDRPLFVQFCANKPEEFLEAARYVAPYCDAVDLNLGCPQGIARSGHYGAFLQEDWDTIYKLINTLHKDLSVPVTAKMRVLATREKTLEYAKLILSAGASILTVHGRRREQKGHNTGLADWSILRYLRESLPPETVLFANGNILNHSDIQSCLDYTGFDGVMSAEANLADPTVFASPPADPADREYWRSPAGNGGYRVDGVVRRYLDIIYRYVLEQPTPARTPLYLPGDDTPEIQIPEPPAQPAVPSRGKKRKREQRATNASPSLRPMQGHLFGMLRSVVGVHTDIRDALAKSKAGDMPAFERVLAMLEKAVRTALDEEAATAGKARTEEAAELVVGEGEAKEMSEMEKAIEKYKRPWWVCQPYIRPSPEEAVKKGAMTLGKKDKEDAKRQKNGQEEVGAAHDGVRATEAAVEADVEAVKRVDEPDVVDRREQVPAAAVVCG